MVISGRGLWEVTRIRCYKGEALINGTSTFKRVTRELAFSLCSLSCEEAMRAQPFINWKRGLS